MKHLLLCRHAKSSWKDSRLADFDRPLNKRGKKDGPEMGRRLADRGVDIDLIVSSPACRALKTAKLVAREMGYARKNIRLERKIYDSFPTALLRIIHQLENHHERVMLVGHNPETTMLANILGDLSIDNVPTCGIVALDFAVDTWQDIREGGGILVFFDYPKKEKRDDTS